MLGPKSRGSSPLSQEMKHASFPYFINHYNFNMSQKKPYIRIMYSKKLLTYTSIFYRIGAIKSFLVTKTNNKKFIFISVNHYKNTPCFKSIRQVSRSSKNYNVSYSVLKILTKSLNQAIIILSTSRGIITNRQALKYRTGGLVLAIIL
uniref:Ribosomal protein S8 n=1 Tax=Strombidium cf. sulcatum TaxID=2793073 RepID=A0A7T0M4L8_9SPIT|nr:ribosomal protein S8 [Strombidium cf. sulcatum]QPL15944.1 ribosomal protein S8 [Strombidium cf. sulcatum]